MSGDKSATREEKTSVLGEDNPGVRRVGPDRMAAMDMLASQRREAVSAESGVTIEASKAKPGEGDPDAEREDHSHVDPDDPDGSKARAAKADLERQEREAADASRRTAAEDEEAKKKEADAQLRRQMASDDRVVLDGDLSRYSVRGKIDGVDTEMSLDRAVRVLQKDYAADKRLEEATRKDKEAAATLKAAQEELARVKAGGDKTEIKEAERKAKDAQRTSEELKEKFQAASDALFAGDTATAANAFAEILGPGRAEGATPDMEQLVEAVSVSVENRTALKRFQKDYPEIVNNQHLAAMCDAKVSALVAGGISYEDALADAGDYVRGEIKALAKTQGMTEGKGQNRGRDDLRSRKAEIDEPSIARSAQASTAQAAAAPGVSSVIAEMAEQRRPQPKPRPT